MSDRNGTDAPDPGWVDELLLERAAPTTPTLHLGTALDRAALRRTVHAQQRVLTDGGLRRGGTVALQLPPSLTLVANLLAAWRTGAQVILLDHRLTQHEVDRALRRTAPQFLVRPAQPVRRASLRGFHDITSTVRPLLQGRPAATGHVLVQLSSGSTGPSKVIGRTAAELMTEVYQYTALEHMPRQGHRVVLLSSLIHALGLVTGLLHSLHVGIELTLPPRMTAGSILAAVGAGRSPTVLVGVPFHAQLLASVTSPPPLPQLVRAINGSDRVRPDLARAFGARYGIPLGEVYGMTELGAVAADLTGANRPATGWPAPGVELRVVAGELLVRRSTSPYLGLADPTRWVDGWLHTRDAAEYDQETGLVTVLGRLDSQVAVGGLKVDLTEVEWALTELPGVREAVVSFDGAVEAYLALDQRVSTGEVEQALAERIAGFKLPRRWHVVPALPRTTTGKPVRDRAALRAAAGAVR